MGSRLASRGRRHWDYASYFMGAGDVARVYGESGISVPPAVVKPKGACFDLAYNDSHLVVMYVPRPVRMMPDGSPPRSFKDVVAIGKRQRKISGGGKRMTMFTYSSTKRGTLIYNIQNAVPSALKGAAEKDLTHQLLDGSLMERIGLDVFKTLQLGERLHVVSPNEVLLKWGKKSPFFMLYKGFLRFVQEKHPTDLEKILARIMHEIPELRDDLKSLAASVRGFSVDRLAEIAGEVSTKSSVPGSKLLRRRLEEFLRENPHKHLGRRTALRYYRDVPVDHGFVVQDDPVDFGGGPIKVLTYEPADAEGQLKKPPFEDVEIQRINQPL